MNSGSRARVCAAVIFCFGFSARAGTQAVDGVVAYVNEHVITGGDVVEAVQPILPQVLSASKGGDRTARVRKVYEDALNSLIERHLILDAYEKMEQKIPEWAIDQRINEIIRDSFNDNRANLMTALSKGKMTFEEWRTQVKGHIVLSSMRGERVERHTRVTPQAIRKAYDENRAKYRTPDTMWLRLIALKRGTSAEDAAAKRKEADEIKKQLDAGEDFGTLAKAKSQGSKAENGGDLSWLAPRMLRPELAAAAAGMTPGEISGVIETQDEFYLLKLEGRKEGAVPSFEEVQSQIERDLRQDEASALYDAWIDALKKIGYVKVLDIGPYVNVSLP